MDKLIYYIAILVLTVISVLVIAANKIAIDFAIIIAVSAFLVLLAVKND